MLEWRLTIIVDHKCRGNRKGMAPDVILDHRNSRMKPDALPQLSRIVHAAIRNDARNFANIADVFQRIAVHQNQVGALSWLN